MKKSKKLSLYWGEKGLALVEAHKNELAMFSSVSFDSLENDPMVGVKSLVDDPRLVDLIQVSYRSARFSTVDTCLSLPSKDIIIRWFVIPWMKPEEIQGVVVFEARKHLPFSLEELSYTYHPSVFSKDGMRYVGISFVAVRKPILTSYLNVLRQAGLNVVYTEASSLSLVRFLVVKKLMDVNLVTAILHFHQDFSEIIISSQGYIRFIRDFKLALSEENLSEEKKGLVRAKMFNEIKMSLDFFSRQQLDADVKSVITISSAVSSDMWEGLGEELGISIRHVDFSTISDKSFSLDEGLVYALGAALSGGVPSVVDLDLSENQGTVKQIQTSVEPIKLKTLVFSIGAILISAAISWGIFIGTQWFLEKRERERALVEKSLGTDSEKSLETLVAEKKALAEHLEAIRSLPFRSEATTILMRVIKSIPDGVWFQSFSLSAEKESASGSSGAAKIAYKMIIEGYVYWDSTSVEFEVISRFVDALKEDKFISELFKDIKLKSSKKTMIEKIMVTSFFINFE